MTASMLDLAVSQILAAVPAGAPPSRLWLESASWIVPAAWATRLLLAADLMVLVLLAFRQRRPLVMLPVALGAGFIVLNALAMILTDFFVGLLAFHLAIGATALVLGGRMRWAGAGLLVATLALGLST
jgi:hypothetical protein